MYSGFLFPCALRLCAFISKQWLQLTTVNCIDKRVAHIRVYITDEEKFQNIKLLDMRTCIASAVVNVWIDADQTYQKTRWLNHIKFRNTAHWNKLAVLIKFTFVSGCPLPLKVTKAVKTSTNVHNITVVGMIAMVFLNDK